MSGAWDVMDLDVTDLDVTDLGCVASVFKLERHSNQRRGALLVRRTLSILLVAVLLLGVSASANAQNNSKSVGDARDDSSPWGVASGAEWFSAYPLFSPILKQAGVRWLRGSYEWQTVQPKQGYWNFALPDALAAYARTNGIHLTAVLAYLAPWASADGSTRRFPIKDIQFWRDYVSGMVGRYHSDIKYWEVWNEFDGSFSEGGTPATYAELVREASMVAKKIDPTAKIGMSVANFDVNFLDAAIKAGAAGHFDYICVHPYEMLARLSDGGEYAFLNMTMTLRKMLEANHQPQDIPLWITEIGASAPQKQNDALDKAQAVLLTKAFVLSISAGFKRIFWFEARGPSYGDGMDFGLLRSNMAPRPSFEALNALTSTLGQEPRPAGWLNLDDGGYGFVFDTSKQPVLAAWSPPKREINITFEKDVRLTTLSGANTLLPAGKTLTITEVPVLITELPTDLLEKARAQIDKPYPWAGAQSGAAATAQLKADNVENGVKQIKADTTIGSPEARRLDFSRTDNEGHYVYFWVDPQFASFGTNAFEITAVVRRVAPDKVAGMSLDYESSRGYKTLDYHNISDSDGWQEVSWKVQDANFVGAWGWNFRLNAIASPNEFLVKEVKVKKVQ